MTPSGQTVCLCMIVKDEAPVIRRCLDSVRPIIDRWLIVDTGSTDGTQGIIREHFRGVPGELVERPWRDFAHNRSEALALARPLADYSLIVDADDAFEVPAGYTLPVLDADSYVVDIEDGSITYQRTQLVSNALPWRYAGVLHEFLTCEGAKSSGHLPIAMRRNHDGARRRDPDTYRKDAALLERALETETDAFFVSRYTFYLAQSYRDSDEPEKALKHYLARADLGFWEEEVFVALLQAARLREQLGHPVDDVLAAYERAAASRPTRAEALHGASRLCRFKDRFGEGAALARRGLAIPKPSGALFLEDWIYDYGLADELSVSAYWSGQYQESLDASLKMLNSDKCPAGERQRAEANAGFARQKLLLTAAPRGPIKIAIYTIALDEAPQVERWVKSTAGADYRVVADTGSTDDTVARLRAAGVAVHHISVRPWRFDDARNACLALVPADADICVSLDMDEFMMEGWRAALEAAWTNGTTRLTYNYARGIKPDGSPDQVFFRSKAHSRAGYRWKRIVHEDLQRYAPGEMVVGLDFILMGESQVHTKDRSNYLPLLKLAHEEDRSDSQICFWYARDLMYAGQNEESAEVYVRYLALATSTWAEERSEAMRYLARVRPAQKLEWLQKAIAEAPHRRELWRDLAEHHHSELKWSDLYAACANGLTRCRATGSYLDESTDAGFRLYDLGALACSHLGLIDEAIAWGSRAVELCPRDRRLENNLKFYRSQAADGHSRNRLRPPSEPQRDATLSEVSDWAPLTPQGGTEIMFDGLRRHVGAALAAINLGINSYDDRSLDGRPLVVWIHINIDVPVVQWLDDRARAEKVDWFVFVSNWQKDRFVRRFSLRPERCIVLRNATDVEAVEREWKPSHPLRMAYTSVPERGLSVLIDAWEEINSTKAELHVWSSFKLYGPGWDDSAYTALYERAAALPNVLYHGIVPNAELRRSLREMDFLVYPSTLEETSCIAVMEAMAAGCRVICPDLGALAETTAGFARLYPHVPDPVAHARAFAQILREEIEAPWAGQVHLSEQERHYARRTLDWSVRAAEWRAFIARASQDHVARPAASDTTTRTVSAMSPIVSSLTRLKRSNFNPTGIIDIGAHDGRFAREVRSVFPDAYVLMIDALAEKNTILADLVRQMGNASHQIALLGDEENEATSFFVADTDRRPELDKSGSSKFKENTLFPFIERRVSQRKLSNVLSEVGRSFQFVKLDVQGAEIAVLRGMEHWLSNVEAILMEISLADYNAGAPTFADVIQEMQRFGFVLTDIADEHRYRTGHLLQIDGLFVRSGSNLRPQPPFWA